MKVFFFTKALLLTVLFAQAQKNVRLSINHKLASAAFAFNQTSSNSLSQDFQFTRATYYISGIKIIHDGGQVIPVNKYLLVKSNQLLNELLGSFSVTNVEGITLSIGVDGSVNNADPSLQPSGAPLALQNPSMHWGWASGYIFAALEGVSGTSLNTAFELHGLGNANYFSQNINVAGVDDGNNTITVFLEADLTEALRGIDVASGPIQHGTNLGDLTMLNNFRDHVFSPGPAISSTAEASSEQVFSYVPTMDRGIFNLSTSLSATNDFNYSIHSVSGILLQIGQGLPASINLSNMASGLYLMRFMHRGGASHVVKLMVY